MTSRTTAWIALCLLILVLVVLLWRTIPWDALESGQRGERPISADFTQAQIDKAAKFRDALRPWSLGALVLSFLTVLVFGLTPLGTRLIETVARPFGGGWVWQALLGGAALMLLAQLLVFPLRMGSHVVLRRYGLSTQSWGPWMLDTAKAWAVSTVLTATALLVFYALVRAFPQWWWVSASVGAATLVVLLSFAFPLVIEPLFNKFTPMPESPLRTQLLEMAQRDGVPVKDVLVADASRRTTGLNAYVSGFGPSRRVVVYDTLLKDAPPEEVKLVVAHELGHAKYRDVLIGTVTAAVGVAVFVVGIFLLLSWQPLLSRAGIEKLSDPRSAGLVLALVAIVALISSPVQGGISRRVEARSDEYSLALTRDPQTFISMHKRLAVTNLSDLSLNRILYLLFASHPSTVERIGHARDYEARLSEKNKNDNRNLREE